MIGVADEINGLYAIQMQAQLPKDSSITINYRFPHISSQICNFLNKASIFELWHLILGHPSFDKVHV